MKIVFVHFGVEFDGDTLKSKPLGGTETALIGASRELAKIEGNEVFVFTNTPHEAVFDSVHYHPVAALEAWALQNNIDVLISIRQWLVFWLPLKARLKIYFSPDAHDQPFLQRAFEMSLNIKGNSVQVPLFEPSFFMGDIDFVFCVGHWQAKTFVEKLKIPEEKIFVTGNGYFPENFSPLNLSERTKNVMYSSTPFRGLDHLIRFFPLIKKQCPDAGLEVCSGMGVYGLDANKDNAEYGDLYRALAKLGALSHGSVKQQELAQIMCRNRVYAYPNTFEETFCISVLEAQAAGLPVVTSNKGALPERITSGVDGFLITGEPHEDKYIREFVAATTQLVSNNDLWVKMSQAAIKRASSQTYAALVQKWMVFFEKSLATKSSYTQGKIPQFKQTEVFITKPAPTKLSIDPLTLTQFVKQAFQSLGFNCHL